MSIEERRRLVRELHPRLTQLEIALELGVSPTTVARDEKALQLERSRGRPAGQRSGAVKVALRKQRTAMRAAAIAERSARAERAAAAYEESSLAAIATAEGVSAQTVWKDLRRLGKPRRKPGRRAGFEGSVDERRDLVLELYDGSVGMVGRRLGISSSLAYRDLLQAGGRIRSPRPRRPETKRDAMRALFARLYPQNPELTLNELASRANVSSATVLRDLEAGGIARRPAAHEWWQLDRPRALLTVGRALYARTGHKTIFRRHAKELAAAKGKTVGRRNVAAPFEKDILKLKEEGHSHRSIARIIGVPRQSVARLLASRA